MDSLSGANRDGLEALAKKWSANVPSQHSCPIPGQMDLLTFLDRSNLECLNEDTQRNIRLLFEGRGSLHSDCDEQLIVGFFIVGLLISLSLFIRKMNFSH